MKAFGVLESKWDLIRDAEISETLTGGAGQDAPVLFCLKGGDEEDWSR